MTQTAKTQTMTLTDEQKDVLRALYDRAVARVLQAEAEGQAKEQYYHRWGIESGIDRAASALGFDIYADWCDRTQKGKNGAESEAI